MPLRLAVRDIAFFERPVSFRPAVPVRRGRHQCDAAGFRAGRDRGRRQGQGDRGQRRVAGAEMVRQAAASVAGGNGDGTAPLAADRARALSGASGFDTAFGLHAACIGAQVEACAREDIPPLAAAYGPAEIDKAILDALLRCAGRQFLRRHGATISPASMRGCRAISAMTTSRSFWQAASGWSASRSGTPSAWTTRSKARAASPTVKENAGARYFKLKLNGDPAHDAERLIRIGEELATLPYDYRVTLDANEQYADLAALGALVERLDRDAALRPIAAKSALHRAADAARHHPAIAARRAGAARFHRRRGRRFL